MQPAAFISGAWNLRRTAKTASSSLSDERPNGEKHMKRIASFAVWLSFIGMPLWAMPSQTTFQGTLKEHGVPVNTTKNMQFSFVDGAGATIAGTSPILVSNVQVTNGLFAVQLPLDPTIPWERYTPFIQVSIEGQILSPNQPMNANLYAVATFPQGFVGMFTTSCPAGWTRLAALDNAFPMGGATYGATGGSATSTTNHGVVFSSGQGSGSFWGTWKSGDSTLQDKPVSTLPPYVTMVFCRKD
jgi:hypothetical protein